MSDVRPRYLPIPVPFPELNVRTYVKTAHRAGVWFFSLDAANCVAASLQPAAVELRHNTMIEALGIQMPRDTPLCHFSRFQEVVAWPIISIDHAEI